MELKIEEKAVNGLNELLQINENAAKLGVLDTSKAYGVLVNFLSQNLKPIEKRTRRKPAMEKVEATPTESEPINEPIVKRPTL